MCLARLWRAKENFLEQRWLGPGGETRGDTDIGTWRTGRLSGKRAGAPGRRAPMQPETERDDASTPAREGASTKQAESEGASRQRAMGARAGAPQRASDVQGQCDFLLNLREFMFCSVLLAATGSCVVETRPAKLLPVVVSET